MQTVNSPDYYLKHSFEKTYSDYGVPYVDEACAVDQSNNIVIYGHHMKNKTMDQLSRQLCEQGIF